MRQPAAKTSAVKITGWIVGLVALAIVAHLAGVWAIPRVIMAITMGKMGGPDRANHERHPPLPSETSRTVVMPSPDMLYTTCVFDVSTGPVVLTAQVPDTYWSVALYAANSDNFFVLNDRHVPSSRSVKLVLAKDPVQLPPGVGVVAVIPPPTSRGIVLFRTLVESADRLPAMQNAQQSMTCRKLAP